MTLLKSRLSIAWLLLLAATLFSFESSSIDARLAGIIVITIAMAKVAVVGREFMELRDAPASLALVFYAWAAVLWGALIATPYLVNA